MKVRFLNNTDRKCPQCSTPLVLLCGEYGQFYHCGECGYNHRYRKDEFVLPDVELKDLRRTTWSLFRDMVKDLTKEQLIEIRRVINNATS